MEEDINSYRRRLRAAGIPESEISQMVEDRMSLGEGGSSGSGDISASPDIKSSKTNERAARMSSANTSGVSDIGGAVATYGAATGNPAALGAGLGLQVLSAGQKRKQKEQELKAEMRLDRIQRQQNATQNALQNLMQLSQVMSL